MTNPAAEPPPDEAAPSPIPIISLWGRLLVPLQGDIRDSQLEDLERRLLGHIKAHGAEGLAIDLSGVWMLDSHLCATLGRLAASVRLMGVKSVLSGMAPVIALTLDAMGFDLGRVKTALGLEEAMELLGVTVTPTEQGDDEPHQRQGEDRDDADADADEEEEEGTL